MLLLKVLNMHVTIVAGETSPQFLVLFSLFFKVVFPLSHACCLISVMLSNVKYHNLITGSSQSFSVLLKL
jgi:hypothetical protein